MPIVSKTVCIEEREDVGSQSHVCDSVWSSFGGKKSTYVKPRGASYDGDGAVARRGAGFNGVKGRRPDRQCRQT